MIEFILGLVQSVMGPVVADLVMGRTASVRKREIEMAIAAAARERQSLDPEQVSEIVTRTMAEVIGVVERDPDLTWRFHKVSLKKPVKADSEPLQKELVSERLHRLQFLINERRQALKLPTTGADPAPPATATDDGTPQESGVTWEQVLPEEDAVSIPELDQLKKRINDRRAGRHTDGDQRS